MASTKKASNVAQALLELIEQASREDDGNFFAGAVVRPADHVVNVTFPTGEFFQFVTKKIS